MSDLNHDPYINVIQNQIKRSIRVTLENQCYAATVILVYSGIDSMAYLDMPRDQIDVTRDDFVRWADSYIHFPCKEQISGLELYGARCGMLHAHSITSKLSRNGRVRQIGYMNVSVPEIRFNANVAEGLVMLSIEGLAKAFIAAIDQFLIEAYSDSNKAELVESRLCTLVHILPRNQ